MPEWNHPHSTSYKLHTPALPQMTDEQLKRAWGLVIEGMDHQDIVDQLTDYLMQHWQGEDQFAEEYPAEYAQAIAESEEG